MLTNRHKLALVSSTPGKTMLINHFLINNNWHLVDLPGYGYVKSSKNKREEFIPMTMNYILNRKQLVLLFALIDSRLEPQTIDINFINTLGENQIPFAIVFTKTDKLSKTALNRQLENYKNTLSEMWEELPPIFTTSTETGFGRQEILDYIETLNKNYTSITVT
jgi:GTP-binding protein